MQQFCEYILYLEQNCKMFNFSGKTTEWILISSRTNWRFPPLDFSTKLSERRRRFFPTRASDLTHGLISHTGGRVKRQRDPTPKGLFGLREERVTREQRETLYAYKRGAGFEYAWKELGTQSEGGKSARVDLVALASYTSLFKPRDPVNSETDESLRFSRISYCLVRRCCVYSSFTRTISPQRGKFVEQSLSFIYRWEKKNV